MITTQAIRRIEAARKDAGLSQLAAARKAGISQAAWWEIANGTQKPRWETVAAMCKAVGLKISIQNA